MDFTHTYIYLFMEHRVPVCAHRNKTKRSQDNREE